MTDIQRFRQDFVDIQRGLMRDYPDTSAVCHMLHDDLGFGHTPREDAEERAAMLSETTGETADIDSIEFTEEHAQLHSFLAAIKAQAMIIGASMDQILATMFIIGRRYGLKEAAGALSQHGDDLSLEEWLKDETDPEA